MLRVVAAIVFTTVALVAPVTASATNPNCAITQVWSDKGDTWKFERCGDMMTVHRRGVNESCSRKYPVGSLYTGPESDCAYYGPLF